MKFEFIPCTLKYALLARKRSKTDGGTLFFALIDYYAFGKKQTFENEGMQVLFDLFVGDIDEFLAGRKKLSQTNANNASCKGNAGKSNNKKSMKSMIAARATTGTSLESPIDANDGNAADYDAVDCDDADNDGGDNDGNDSDSSDDGGDSATDDDDSSLSAENTKPPEVVSKHNDRGNHKKSLKVEQHISDDKNGSDRDNSIGAVDFVSESSDRSGSEGSLKNTIEASYGIDRSEFNATQHAKNDSSDGSDRNGRSETEGLLMNAIETNDSIDRSGFNAPQPVKSNFSNCSDPNDRSDSISTVYVVSESNDRKGDYESVVMPDVTNDRNNHNQTDSITQLAPVASTIATDSSDSADSIAPATSISSMATTEDNTATTFARLRDLYNKTGDNESRAFELWQRLSAKERADALSYAETIAGNSGYRSYLYVFLRDKEWLKPKANSH